MKPRKNAHPTPDRPTLQRENELAAGGFKRIAGVDEAGRGPLAGPVVAAAVILPRGFANSALASQLNDSKQLSPASRETSCEALISVVEYGIGLVDAATIDQINIRQASWRAMQKAVADLESRARDKHHADQAKTVVSSHMSTHVRGEHAAGATRFDCAVDYVLIDGLPYGDGPWLYEAIVKGDSKSLSIAAASIIAKETRDRLMREWDALYPQYGFASHKGYGVPRHLRALSEHGPCAIHRVSFAPVKNAVRPCAGKEEAGA